MHYINNVGLYCQYFSFCRYSIPDIGIFDITDSNTINDLSDIDTDSDF